MDEIQTEDQVAGLVAEVRAGPARRDALVELLREDAPVHAGCGTNTTARIRAWVLAAFADVGLPDEALPYVLEELESGREPVLVAAAATALRGRASIDARTAGLLARALSNMVDIDEPVTFESLRPSWPAQRPTTALLEILACLCGADAGPAIQAELEQFRRDHGAQLSRQVHERLDETIATMSQGPRVNTASSPNEHREFAEPTQRVRRISTASSPAAAPCCGSGDRPVEQQDRDVHVGPLPDGVGHVGPLPDGVEHAGPLPDGVEFEDQDGTRLTCADFFPGRPTALAFFYTRCANPNKCSLTVTKLAELRRSIDEDTLRVAAVTYDPGFDLPDRLRRYGSDRGLRFGPSTRMLRAVAGHETLRDHFALRVGYGGSVVNRHAIELFLLDHRGSVASAWSRAQWDPADVVERARRLEQLVPPAEG